MGWREHAGVHHPAAGKCVWLTKPSVVHNSTRAAHKSAGGASVRSSLAKFRTEEKSLGFSARAGAMLGLARRNVVGRKIFLGTYLMMALQKSMWEAGFEINTHPCQQLVNIAVSMKFCLKYLAIVVTSLGMAKQIDKPALCAMPNIH